MINVSIRDDSVILVTGSTGFLGHHLVQKLEEYRNGGTSGARRGIRILTPHKNYCNLLDQKQVEYYLKAGEPDIVIHLAAQCAGIGGNQDKPGEFIYHNTLMSANLIEACRKMGFVKKFVGVGTVCMYPRNTPVPFKEEDLFNGYPEETNAPYGIAKRLQLEMLKAYKKQYNFNGIFLVPVNMAGPHDNFDDATSHVIPAMLKKFHQAQLTGQDIVQLWGDGSASREFLYVGDCAEAILRATLLYDDLDPVNIGTGQEITMRSLAEKIKDLVGFKGEIVWDTTKPNGQPRRCLDVTKARERFGFVAETHLDKILERTYKWAREDCVV